MWINISSFNIWHCGDYTKAPKNVVVPENISDFIYENDIAICGMQEVGVNWNRGGYYDQPKYIAEKLSEKTGIPYYSAFAAGLEEYHHEGAFYGNAIVSKYPIKNYRAVKLKMTEKQIENDYEHRAMLIAELDVMGRSLTVIATHFDLKEDARLASVKALKEELKSISTPVVFMADLNAFPDSEVISEMSKILKYAGDDINAPVTFPSTAPKYKIDYIFKSNDINTRNIRIIPEVKCSDHCPLVVDMEW